jgi:hypothetical protein
MTGSIVRSAEAAKVDKSMHYRWLKQSEKYADDFKAAFNEFADVFEGEAIRRANEGVLEPVFYQGVACGAVRRYDSGLMQMMLPRFKPEYRRQISAEVTGKNGKPIESSITVSFVKPE